MTLRQTTPAVSEALQSGNLPMLVMVELDFASGVVRLANAGYNFDFGGYTWIGTGNLGTISGVEEGLDLQMYGCTLSLTGLAAEYIAEALNEEYKDRPASIWLAPLDDNYQILSDPVLLFKGTMDTMPVTLGPQGSIQITVESPLADWERPRSRRYNHEDQISEYPDDLGLEFIPQMVEKELIWGRP